VLDEADKICGKSKNGTFEKDLFFLYESINKGKENVPPRILAFSATYSEQTLDLLNRLIKDKN
jgi:superfamily II DNA/RNA helicase